MGMLRQAIVTDNKGLAESSIAQLAEDIEALESSLKRESSRAQKSLYVTLVGVVPTVVFGLLSLFFYFFPRPAISKHAEELDVPRLRIQQPLIPVARDPGIVQ